MLVKKKTLANKFLVELIKIFKEHNWDVETSENGEYSVFDMFCERLEELDDDSDRELMLELTHNYLWVNSYEYEKYMTEVFRKFLDTNKESMKRIQTIHIFPVQDKDWSYVKI